MAARAAPEAPACSEHRPRSPERCRWPRTRRPARSPLRLAALPTAATAAPPASGSACCQRDHPC
eukprot:scaffold26853_cov33-Phaeocystis_antarctica.AAC.1